MGGKTATSTQQVQVPPQVLAAYQSVNAVANDVALQQPTPSASATPSYSGGIASGPWNGVGGQPGMPGTFGPWGGGVAPQQQAASQPTLKPFVQYGGEFVAPINQQQGAGMYATDAASGEAQPYFGAATGTLGNAQGSVNPINQFATGLAAGSAQQVNPADLDSAAINKYMSPYLSDVVGSESALLNQNNQQQQAGQLGNAITSGAFGGDRTGIAAANLEQQQNLANANIYSGLLNQGYNTALNTAQQQQGVGLAAGQANRAALGNAAQTLSGVGQTSYGEGANTASELGNLGTGAQSAGLSGAQAQIAAGTVQQQTQQAQDTAQYNQFLQQQSYPFQVAQFLANIAEGTGALSGSTTTTTQPGGFFSDERLKEDMEPIGRTFDGQPIYRYKMKGDQREQIGLSAQQVEKRHPNAVGLAGGYRYVDYGKATEEAANRGHFYEGGVVPFRRAYAMGGSPSDEGGLGAVLQAQQRMYGAPGQQQRNIAGPTTSHQLAVASGTPPPPSSGSSGVSQAIGLGQKGYQAYKWATKPPAKSPTQPNAPTSTPATPNTGVPDSPGTTTNFEGADAGTTTNFDAGLDAGANTGAAAPADTAGLGAADTSAVAPAASSAADVAGTGAAEAGAADAAAGAAAGAGTGAAAGAAGAAAGTAAADAAAALAAEYAAADVAAAAIIAAHRGGAIRRGYDAGGVPYSDTGDQIDIPDEQTSVHLQTAGPIQKQPTGLQTAMKMGDPNQWSSMAGSMFSNQGLATGGVAGRRGYDDGGAPTADDDSASPTDAVPSVIAGDSSGVAGASDQPSFWEKVKKHATAENVIPILTGLAAMGTAKTRSPGVALAAGLGAGSQSYLETRKSLADTAREQARAQGLDIANRMADLKLGVAKDALAPPTSVVTPRQAVPTTQPPIADPASVPSSAQTATGLDAQYRNQFFVNPARTPEEQAAKDAAIKKDWAVGGTMFQTQADNDYEARVKRDQSNARNTAQQLADARYAQFNSAANPADKQVALAHYNALRQWTGDETAIEGGIVKNGRTKQPEIGTIAQQGFTPTEESRFMDAALAPMDVRDPDTGQVTTLEAWRAHHAASPQAYANSLKVNSTAAPASAGVTARPPPARAPIAAPAPNAGAGVIGTSQSPVAARQQALDQEAVTNARSVGDKAPQNRNINQHLLQLSANTTTGPWTSFAQRASTFVPGISSGSRYQEMDAYLNRQAAEQAEFMGVPHTNAGLSSSQAATGSTEYTPQALQEKVKYADALNTGAMAYRQGLDKAIGTDATPNLKNYQAFRSAWARNFDPDIFRVDDAQRRGDTAELDAISKRLGEKGKKALYKKSVNLKLLENGQIPP